MSEDIYIIAIAALLPLTACMLVCQVNPYHALVIRGILGAVAAMVYALFGAADVALTEALVGTMLSITLYAVAVRSSLSMRLGVVQPVPADMAGSLTAADLADPLRSALRRALRKQHLRLELIPFPTVKDLQNALAAKEVHTICMVNEWPQMADASLDTSSAGMTPAAASYHLQTRLPRLYDLMQAEIQPPIAQLSCIDPDSLNSIPTAVLDSPNPAEVQL